MYSGPRLIIFLCGSFLKSSLDLLQYCFCFMFWFFGHKPCGILVPWPGIKPTIPAMEMQSLNPWSAREVPRLVIALSFFSLPFSYTHTHIHLYVYTYTHTFFLNHLRVQFSHSVVSNSLRPHGPQHTRLPCPSPTPRTCSNSCPSSPWCHPTISSSVVPFSSCLQSFLASGSFPMSQFFTLVYLKIFQLVFPENIIKYNIQFRRFNIGIIVLHGCNCISTVLCWSCVAIHIQILPSASIIFFKAISFSVHPGSSSIVLVCYIWASGLFDLL